jgi:hemolysin activation/secretion protein
MPILMLAGSALAQAPAIPVVPADAGSLRQQIERTTLPALPAESKPLKPAEPTPLKLPDGATITVNTFRFAGNTLLPSEQLAPAVVAYLGRPLGFAELQQATQAVAKLYREAGWIVRAYLPRQDVTEGIITIQIVEAVFAGARLEGPEPTRLTLSTVLSRFDAQQKTGAPLNAEALDRALLLADDLPGVTVAGTLAEGNNAGETELVLKLSDEPLLIGEIGLDNAGSRSTGEQRITLNASFNSLLGIGDQLSANVLHTQGSDYTRLAWTAPVGDDGLRLGANTSHLSYHLVPQEFAALKARGTSDAVGLEANYPLIRSRQRNLYLSLAHDQKSFHNDANNAVQSDYDVASWTLGLNGNLFDTLAGGGANSLSLLWTTGRVDQGLADIGETPSLAGRFDKWRYTVARQQVITSDVSLLANVSGQYADKDLDSSERFFLGGPAGVRAYPASEGGGSRGQLATAELRWRLPEGVVLTGFYDWGHVDNFAVGSKSYSLKGYGVGVTWTTSLGLNLKAVWARRDGSNPNLNATNGRDQDGSLDLNRWWLTASLPF